MALVHDQLERGGVQGLPEPCPEADRYPDQAGLADACHYPDGESAAGGSDDGRGDPAGGYAVPEEEVGYGEGEVAVGAQEDSRRGEPYHGLSLDVEDVHEHLGEGGGDHQEETAEVYLECLPVEERRRGAHGQKANQGPDGVDLDRVHAGAGQPVGADAYHSPYHGA